jgi:cytochrome c biogenesis protein CcmG/thiol:disulfide interchange protein DsbE
MVVNLWASWCIPCRSEAPLLTEAHRQLGDEIRFIGVATQDTQVDAEAFVAEFSMTFENYFDRSGEVKGWIGSLGLPTTFFVAPGGEVVSTVFGIIDERALALEIDELLSR